MRAAFSLLFLIVFSFSCSKRKIPEKPVELPIEIVVEETYLPLERSENSSYHYPKRELRGAWVASIANIDWPSAKGLSSNLQKEEFIHILNHHQKRGINAVFVQIRAASDAFYAKSKEPWSEWLNGKQGVAPVPFYDPLEFMIEESHKRGMEFHAWFNLNRGMHKNASSVLESHVTRLKPEWFLSYDGYLLYNFGIPDVRNYILKTITDVVENYDIDGVHLDDYFYPYKVNGEELQDLETFAQHKNGFTNIEDWRRDNIDTIIKDLYLSITTKKKWVKFGVSPFGVWRNASEDTEGSLTKAGQPSYDYLFADTRKWARMGWVDYLAPQIYFAFESQYVPYASTVNWWRKNHGDRHLIIGHAVYKVGDGIGWDKPDQLARQIQYNRLFKEISGSIFYNTSSMVKNTMGVADTLQSFYSSPALQPLMPWKDNEAPLPVKLLKAKVDIENNVKLEWEYPYAISDLRGFVLYRFEENKQIDLNNTLAIQKIVYDPSVRYFEEVLPVEGSKYTYVVTAIDRLNNESEPSLIKIKYP